METKVPTVAVNLDDRNLMTVKGQSAKIGNAVSVMEDKAIQRKVNRIS